MFVGIIIITMKIFQIIFFILSCFFLKIKYTNRRKQDKRGLSTSSEIKNDKVENRNSYNEAYLLLRRILNIVSRKRICGTRVYQVKFNWKNIMKRKKQNRAEQQKLKIKPRNRKRCERQAENRIESTWLFILQWMRYCRDQKFRWLKWTNEKEKIN